MSSALAIRTLYLPDGRYEIELMHDPVIETAAGFMIVVDFAGYPGKINHDHEKQHSSGGLTAQQPGAAVRCP
jgi:hypothetical protein